VPRVAIKTGHIGPDGKEVILQEYLCDWPDCGNVAEHVVGAIMELRAAMIVCRDHAAAIGQRGQHPD
jgi:hypothetical protein